MRNSEFFLPLFFWCEPLRLYFCIHALNGESASNIIPFNVMLFMSFVPSFGNNNSLQTKMHNPYRMSVWFVRMYAVSKIAITIIGMKQAKLVWR